MFRSLMSFFGMVQGFIGPLMLHTWSLWNSGGKLLDLGSVMLLRHSQLSVVWFHLVSKDLAYSFYGQFETR